jgi:hypothetical protein
MKIVLESIEIDPEIFKPKDLGHGQLSTDLHNIRNVI